MRLCWPRSRAVVRAVLLDTEARGDRKDDASYGRLKNPAQLVANVLRAFDVRSADGQGGVTHKRATIVGWMRV